MPGSCGALRAPPVPTRCRPRPALPLLLLPGFGEPEAAPSNSYQFWCYLCFMLHCILFIHSSQTRLRKGGKKAGTDRFNKKEPQHCQESNSSAPRALFQFSLDRIPRSREVRQSWVSSVLTTLYSILYSLPLTYKRKPDLILCNGPGTCVPVCLSAFLLGLLRIKRTIIVYVESICRVETLSLSGKILYYFSDYFIVQWPNLKKKYPKSVYLGRIV
uniref:UDP-N-acetylglucosamine transferase subunit ALG14 n=1 Tax=Geospiza parvula TaxID=87175 RepID=A0A8C3N523_GEOPR